MSFFNRLALCAIFLSFLLCVALKESKGQRLESKGRVVGVIRNYRNEVLAGATVVVENIVGFGIKSNVNGEYELDLAPGNYTLLLSYTGLETKRITEVEVKKGVITRQDVIMDISKKSEGVEVIVTASARRETVGSLIRSIKNNVAVSDGISLEQIKRTPDVNIAQSLKRINGVTVVENKFVVVRGMGDRYNNVTINGSQVPSTEPNKKSFAFDLLPSNLIDNILVNKTATPDLPADFAGGLVQINTKDIPEKNMLLLSVGTGYNTVSTGKDFISTRIHRNEYFAHAAPNSYWFKKQWDPLLYFQLRSSPLNVSGQINNMNSSVPNNWGLYNYVATPTQDYQISGGVRKRFSSKSSLGILVAGSYRNEQLLEDYLRQGAPGDSNSGKKYIFLTNIGGLFSVAFNHGTNKFTFKNIYARRFSHETYTFSGVDAQLNLQNNYASYFTINQLILSRLEGEHAVQKNKFRVKWFVDAATTKRDQPDNRYMKYFQEGTPVYKLDLGRPNEIGFGSIYSANYEEKRFGGGGDITWNLKFLNKSQKIKIGYLGNTRNAEFTSVFLRPTSGVGLPPDALFGLPDYEVYSQENFKRGILFYNALTTAKNTAADTYDGKQTLTALYGMADFELFPKLRMIGGLRNENYLIKTGLILEQDSVGKVKKDTSYTLKDNGIFPSVNIVYGLNNNSNIRFAFSKTVSRFDFREFANIKYVDFTIPADIYGNPRLKQPYIFNYDLRYEIYPTPGESFSFTIYYKNFKDPIEYLIDGPNASQTYNIFTLNQRSSTNKGLEVDLRKSFGFISKKSKFFNNLFLSGNFSIIRSDVEIDRNEIYKVIGGTTTTYDTSKRDVRKRPLQGLSPYAINLGLLYQGKIIGFNLVYNRFGRRLVFSGSENFQDIYENPRDVIDAQLFLRLLKEKMEVKLNVSDILNQSFIQYNGSSYGINNSDSPNGDPKGDGYNPDLDFVLLSARRGISVSISVNYKF